MLPHKKAVFSYLLPGFMQPHGGIPSAETSSLSLRSSPREARKKRNAEVSVPYRFLRVQRDYKRRNPRHPDIGRRVETNRIGDQMRRTGTKTFMESIRGEVQIRRRPIRAAFAYFSLLRQKSMPPEAGRTIRRMLRRAAGGRTSQNILPWVTSAPAARGYGFRLAKSRPAGGCSLDSAAALMPHQCALLVAMTGCLFLRMERCPLPHPSRRFAVTPSPGEGFRLRLHFLSESDMI